MTINTKTIQGDNFHQANLHVADLSRANLHGADLSRANLHGADLREVKGVWMF